MIALLVRLLPIRLQRASAAFKDPDKGYYRQADDKSDGVHKVLLLELRSTGGQTIVPPSTHLSGEALTWHVFNEAGSRLIETSCG